jgi:hypothetical protein
MKEATALENSLTVYQKVKHRIIALCYILKKTKNICLHVYEHSCSTAIHLTKELKQPKCPSTDEFISKM